MSATYFTSHPNVGYSSFWSWTKSIFKPGYWYVRGQESFAKTGYAVVDDFGNLVEVTA